MSEKKRPKRKLKVTLSALVLVALFVVELYFMINQPGEYLILGVIGLVMLCLVYVMIDQVFKIGNDKAEMRRREYESLYKSEKVSYVSMKTSFLELEKILEEVRANSAFPVEELIKAQKATAKVTIQRSKENATAIMNSNDKVIENIISFQTQLDEVKQMIEEQKPQGDAAASNNEMLTAVQELDASIKNEISKLSSSLENKIGEISVAAPVVQQVDVAASVAESSNIPEQPTMEEAPLMPEEPMMEETPIIPEEPVAVEEPIMSQEPMMEETPIMPEEPVAEEAPQMLEEPMLEDVPQMSEEPVAVEEPIMPEEAMMEEVPLMPEEPVAVEEPIIPEETIVEETLMIQEEPVAVEEPIIPEEPQMAEEPVMPEVSVNQSSDPNHIMTPEEIAALLGEGDSLLGAPEPEPVVEEKPAMPDLSDPGHVMTPEEIAALLANM